MPSKKNTTEDDAMPQDMADETMAAHAAEEEWETVKVGLGREWKFENKAALIGFYMGTQNVEIDPVKNDGRTSALAHQFLLADNSGEIVFLWGSHEIDTAMEEIGTQDKVRVSFLGRESFTSDDGPRQVKRYKVEKAVRK